MITWLICLQLCFKGLYKNTEACTFSDMAGNCVPVFCCPDRECWLSESRLLEFRRAVCSYWCRGLPSIFWQSNIHCLTCGGARLWVSLHIKRISAKQRKLRSVNHNFEYWWSGDRSLVFYQEFLQIVCKESAVVVVVAPACCPACSPIRRSVGKKKQWSSLLWKHLALSL